MRSKRSISTAAGIIIVVLAIVGILIGSTALSDLGGANKLKSTQQQSTTTTATRLLDSEETFNAANSNVASSSFGQWLVSDLEDGSAVCNSEKGLPDPGCTPGATNANVTQSDINSTICLSGWTSSVRPPESYTENLKYKSVQEYGYNDSYVGDYEEDHLIPLELGGSPTSVYNLWAEPHYGAYTSYEKDSLENYLNAQVCDGNMPLVQAQHDIATNWVYYWQLYVGNRSASTTNAGY